MSVTDRRLLSTLPAECPNGIVEPCAAHHAFATAWPGFAMAEAAIRGNSGAGLAIGRYSICWKDLLSDTKVPGLSAISHRKGFWAACSSLWGGRADLPISGLMVTIPEFGAVLIGGRLAVTMISAVRTRECGSASTGGFGVLGAALAGMGLQHDGLSFCREALEVGSFLVVGDGTAKDVAQSGTLLRKAGTRTSIRMADQGLTSVVERVARLARRLSFASDPELPDRPRLLPDISLQDIR